MSTARRGSQVTVDGGDRATVVTVHAGGVLTVLKHRTGRSKAVHERFVTVLDTDD